MGIGLFRSASRAAAPSADVAARAALGSVDEVERILATGAVEIVGDLPGAAKGINGLPKLARVTDAATGATIDAVVKPAAAQAAQEAFAWKAARALGVDDLVAVAVRRFDLDGSVLLERAPGVHPASPRDIANVVDRESLHRLLGFDYVLGNPDRHLQQMRVSPTGLLAFDHGHLGVRHARMPSPLTAPMHDSLHGVAGLRPPAGVERVGALDPAAVAALTPPGAEQALELAHGTALANTRRVRGALMQGADRHARSDAYIDGVIERLRALRDTGEIRYLHTGLA